MSRHFFAALLHAIDATPDRWAPDSLVDCAQVYTDEEDFESGRFGTAAEAVCGADVWVPFRVMGEASSLDEVAACFETAAAGDYFVGAKKPRSSGGAAKKPGAESGAIAEGLRGAFNVLGKAQKNLGIFGLSDDKD